MNALAHAQFDKQDFLSLETRRKDGTHVATPVWFAPSGGQGQVFYVHTQADSGKVKRIRNNGNVRIMPCGRRGQPLGDWVSATAVILPQADGSRIDTLMQHKYGLMWRLFGLFGMLRHNRMVKIKITPTTSTIPTTPTTSS